MQDLARMDTAETSMAMPLMMIVWLSASVLVHRESQLVLNCSLDQRRPSQLLIALTLTTAHKPPWTQQRQTVQQNMVVQKCLVDGLLFRRKRRSIEQVMM